MTQFTPIRVLFALGINQNFFDLATSERGAVWQTTLEFLRLTREMPGVSYIGDIDDDSIQVGPSVSWPWTFYVLADVDSLDTVKAVTGLLRTIPVDEEHTFCKYVRIEARIGRPLTVRDDVELG